MGNPGTADTTNKIVAGDTVVWTDSPYEHWRETYGDGPFTVVAISYPPSRWNKNSRFGTADGSWKPSDGKLLTLISPDGRLVPLRFNTAWFVKAPDA